MLEKIHIFISIFAALLVTIMGILEDTSLDVLSFRIIIVIILFYILGLFLRYFLKKKVFVTKPKEQQSDEDIENENETGDSNADEDDTDEE